MANFKKERGYCSPYSIQNKLFEQREIILYLTPAVSRVVSRDRLVVRTLRCGRSNPDSNPYFCQGQRKIVHLGKFTCRTTNF